MTEKKMRMLNDARELLDGIEADEVHGFVIVAGLPNPEAPKRISHRITGVCVDGTVLASLYTVMRGLLERVHKTHVDDSKTVPLEALDREVPSA